MSGNGKARTANDKAGKRPTPSKSKLHNAAEEMESKAETEAMGAGVELATGMRGVSDMERARSVGRTLEVVGASDATRGADKLKAAEVAVVLSEITSRAGTLDLAEGAAALAASDDIGVQSAIVGALSEGDLATGMKL